MQSRKDRESGKIQKQERYRNGEQDESGRDKKASGRDAFGNLKLACHCLSWQSNGGKWNCLSGCGMGGGGAFMASDKRRYRRYARSAFAGKEYKGTI